MTDADDIDAIAGEYVLGTLPPAERTDVEARRQSEPALAAAIVAWDRWLSPLLEASPDVPPPATVYEAITARLFGVARDTRPETLDRPEGSDWEQRLALRRSVRRWQTAFAGAMAMAAALAVWIVVQPAPLRDQQFVAVLQREAGATAIVLDVDIATRKLTVRPVAASTPVDRNLELWLISGTGSPRSLGTVSPTAVTQASLSDYDRETIEGATYAVTLEPVGGSPSGKPSGTPILLGHGIPEGR